MRRFVLGILCGLVLIAWPVWGQSVFDFVTAAPGGIFTGPVQFPDGTQISSSGVTIPTTSSLTAPDTSTWGSGGPRYATGSTVTFPDGSTMTSGGLTSAATSLWQFPDASVWNNGGIVMAAGKQVSVANGTSAAPGLSFTSQATAGLYREAADDLRLVLSGAIPAWRAYKANATTGLLSVPLGASTGYGVVGGRICTSTTSAATTGTTIQVLATCSIPGNALSVDGMGLKVKAWGQTAANANSKVLGIYYGATQCATLTSTVNNGAIIVETTILRTGAATQECAGMSASGAGVASAMRATPAEDTTVTVPLTVKATTATASGDFTFKGLTVELIN